MIHEHKLDAILYIVLACFGTLNGSLTRERRTAEYALPANIPPLSDNRTDAALVIHPAFPFARESGFNLPTILTFSAK